MMFTNIIKRISEEFTQAWNDLDLDRMGVYLTNDVSVQSPNVSKLYPENKNNIVVGKAAVLAYWQKLIAQEGAFKVTQCSIIKEDNHVITINHIDGTDISIKETFTVNEYGKINYLVFEYTQRT